MKIRIPIPPALLRLYDRFEDWANVPLSFGASRWHIVRLDIVLAALFVFCVGFYYATGGWIMAIQGALLFIFIGMCALWIWKR